MKIITRRKQREAENRIAMILYAFKHRDEIPELRLSDIIVENAAELACIIGGVDSMITVGEHADMLISAGEAAKMLGRLTAQVFIETIKREDAEKDDTAPESTEEAQP